MGFWDSLKELFEDDPIYVPERSDAHVEGWKIAYEQQKERADVAETKLKMLDELADGIIIFNVHAQYGRDIKEIVKMTKHDLESDEYGED